MKNHVRLVLLLGLCACLPRTGFAQEGGLASVEEEFRQTLLRLVQSGALSSPEGPLVIERPAERVSDFGLLVDRDSVDGLVVLGTLPGGSASRLGLQAGDRLVAANGVDLRGPGGSLRMKALLDDPASDGGIELDIVREGHARKIAGTVEAVVLPAMRVELDAAAMASTEEHTRLAGDPGSRCGRVSIEAIAPRTRNLFPVSLIAIDGRIPGTSEQQSFRLPPGRHVLRIGERIGEDHFSSVGNFQRGRLGDRGYKELEVDVEPGVTYFLAARLHRGRSDRILDGGYWEPLVWKERAESCR
ncbi:PDZ domain-containing protein [Pseudofulvimonas gallinarii]|jgi:hypothetical protein|uniref:PDZ domain-containing protein n=2 Tax=Pseudofulvimonas gallinarii TaxID=634155 RepID=A0A4R3L489_9GAMM|nr:PDZ domain-containing protein [Pseudofulvimonas gallinarii]TCS93530.1 hypothetical protein EDC25_12726 [Pseudofulvimonas gallinarii]THD14438.1 hypothetical protein B1808_04040 [Pseudofulvimonas gallinarii]